MGADKATLPFGSSSLATHAARALAAVAYPVLAVGREAGTGLDVVDDPREGPLVAVVHGWDALRARGMEGPVAVLACDMPFVDEQVLRTIAEALGSHEAAVPHADGRDQPLCAVYGSSALETAPSLVAGGHRSMKSLVDSIDAARIAPERWSKTAHPWALRDLDTPADHEDAKRILEGPV